MNLLVLDMSSIHIQIISRYPYMSLHILRILIYVLFDILLISKRSSTPRISKDVLWYQRMSFDILGVELPDGSNVCQTKAGRKDPKVLIFFSWLTPQAVKSSIERFMKQELVVWCSRYVLPRIEVHLWTQEVWVQYQRTEKFGFLFSASFSSKVTDIFSIIYSYMAWNLRNCVYSVAMSHGGTFAGQAAREPDEAFVHSVSRFEVNEALISQANQRPHLGLQQQSPSLCRPNEWLKSPTLSPNCLIACPQAIHKSKLKKQLLASQAFRRNH